jgi:hypothetical protein
MSDEHVDPSERSLAFLDWWHERGRWIGVDADVAEVCFEAGRAAASA